MQVNPISLIVTVKGAPNESGNIAYLRQAAAQAGIAHPSIHAFRHSYRPWLDSTGTPIGVQRPFDASPRHKDYDEHPRQRGNRGTCGRVMARS
jgi:integrase